MARGDHVLAHLGGSQPAGAEAGGRGDSLTRIDHKKTTYEFFGRWRDFQVGEGEITAENVVDCLLLGIIQEWRQATEENIEDDSKRPHVRVGSNRTF